MALDVPGSTSALCTSSCQGCYRAVHPSKRYLQDCRFSQLLEPFLSGLPGHSVLMLLHSLCEQFSLLHPLKPAPREEGALAPS